MEKRLIIVRGLPGSGKSTFARLLGRAVCTADDFFMRNGKYKFNTQQLGQAHEWCKRKCKRFLQRKIDTVIVANTNVTERDLRDYLHLGVTYGYKIFSVIVENRHGNASIHEVPEKTIKKMENNFSIKLS